VSEILAKPEELRQQSTNMKNRADAARSEFSQLRSKLQQIQEQFRGSAAKAFEAQYQDWDKNATDIIGALEGLGDWLAKAAEAVEQTDTQLAKGLG
jgi:WXG100 family type VII secretion target